LYADERLAQRENAGVEVRAVRRDAEAVNEEDEAGEYPFTG